MVMVSFIKAKELYNQGKFQEAYEAYIQLGRIFGQNIVQYQLDMIRKNHNIEQKETALFDNGLDDATKILLSNSGKEKLSDNELSSLMSSWKKKTAKKSEDAEIKKVNPIPADFPKDLVLAPLPEGVNDFEWHQRYKKKNNTNFSDRNIEQGLSVIVPTFNRSHILEITLSCLINQTDKYPFEVIIADDGSQEDICAIVRKYEQDLDIKYVRQKDYGYQLCAVRNLGLRAAKYPFVSILDCDMAPNPLWVESYMDLLLQNDDVALIGPRKYVDTHEITPAQIRANTSLIEQLPEVRTNNSVAGKDDGEISVDWRLEHFKKTENLRLCDTPFRFFSGGNVAFAKKWLEIAGWFDEEFTHWGGEDNEYGYRLFKHGCFFRAVDGGMAYHQEPPGKENETDRAEGKKITLQIVREKVPYFYRKPQPIETAQLHRVPLVTVYIPAYNCADSIQRCVDSALNQTITDLEVCICNDGSTDNTLEVIQALYGNNPRVHIISQPNGGIASASNTAVKNARGYYIAQLDSDDYLEPDAVELCLNEFLKDRSLACVYTANRNVNPDGSLIANGYNWPEFSREKLTTAMIVHHFRMFTARAWHLTTGFDEKIENSVDLDIYLKLSEVGPFKHVNKICYNRVLHGNNISIKKLGIQKKNHFLVVNKSLARQGIEHYSYDAVDDNDESRKYCFNRTSVIAPKSTYNAAPTTKVAFSVVYPEQPIGLLAKLHNIIEYNAGVVAIVAHVDKKYQTQAQQVAAQFEKEHDTIKVLINSDIDYKNHKYRQIEYYLSNFKLLEQSHITFDYIVFDNFDSLCVQHGIDSHIAKFDIGMNFGEINGYWKDKILLHRTLNTWVKHNLNKELPQLRCKGVAQGMFIKADMAKQVFAQMERFWEQCQQNNDLPSYLAEEVLTQLMILAIEESQKQVTTKTATLTYMPWERKLQWTQEQIEAAKQGVGIPKGRFLINRIIFDI